jgi:hypothetical protein
VVAAIDGTIIRVEDARDWREYLPGHPAANGALVPVEPAPRREPTISAIEKSETTEHRPRQNGGRINVRALSSRQMVDISMDLYVGGVISWDEHAVLAFQPELHPDYERTIGALTGEAAAPDRPRNFINQWEQRLSFDRKHNTDNPDIVARTERIVTVLRQLGDHPTSFDA